MADSPPILGLLREQTFDGVSTSSFVLEGEVFLLGEATNTSAPILGLLEDSTYLSESLSTLAVTGLEFENPLIFTAESTFTAVGGKVLTRAFEATSASVFDFATGNNTKNKTFEANSVSTLSVTEVRFGVVSVDMAPYSESNLILTPLYELNRDIDWVVVSGVTINGMKSATTPVTFSASAESNVITNRRVFSVSNGGLFTRNANNTVLVPQETRVIRL
jgi:hypothetical protein